MSKFQVKNKTQLPSFDTKVLAYMQAKNVKADLHGPMENVLLDRPTDSLFKTMSSVKSTQLRNLYKVHRDADGNGTLVSTHSDEGNMVAATLEIAGVVMSTSLPPVMTTEQLWSGIKQGDQTLPMQSISIGGFDHPSFTHAIRGIDNIVKIFSLKYPAVNPLREERVLGQSVLTFNNRYVTPYTAVSPESTEVPFGEDIDPNGIIRRELHARGVHLEDNIVEYYRASDLQPNGQFTAEPANPAEVKVGQVVNIQATPVVVPFAKRAKFKLVLKLRSILIVDDSVQKDALFQVDEGISDTDDTAKSIPSISSLRRQVGYGSAVGKRKRDEEEEEEGDMNETIEQLSKRVKDNVQFTGYRQESADARNSTDE